MAKGTRRLGNSVFTHYKGLTTEERIMLGFQIECQQHYRWDNSTYMKIVIQGMKLYYRPERNNKQQL